MLGLILLRRPIFWVFYRGWIPAPGAVPPGLSSVLFGLTPDLRPGLSHAAPLGLVRGGSFCIFPPLVRRTPARTPCSGVFPTGLGFYFLRSTPDLRPGLSHAAPVGACTGCRVAPLAAAPLIQCEASATGIEFILSGSSGNPETFPEGVSSKVE